MVTSPAVLLAHAVCWHPLNAVSREYFPHLQLCACSPLVVVGVSTRASTGGENGGGVLCSWVDVAGGAGWWGEGWSSSWQQRYDITNLRGGETQAIHRRCAEVYISAYAVDLVVYCGCDVMLQFRLR